MTTAHTPTEIETDTHTDHDTPDPDQPTTTPADKPKRTSATRKPLYQDGQRLPSTPDKGGRPRACAPHTPDQLATAIEEAIAVGNTIAGTAGILGIHRSTISKRYRQAIEIGTARRNTALARAQYRRGVEERNAALLIWLGKQWLGQEDRHVTDAEHRIIVEYTQHWRQPVLVTSDVDAIEVDSPDALPLGDGDAPEEQEPGDAQSTDSPTGEDT